MADGNVTVTTAAKFIPELWRDASWTMQNVSLSYVIR